MWAVPQCNKLASLVLNGSCNLVGGRMTGLTKHWACNMDPKIALLRVRGWTLLQAWEQPLCEWWMSHGGTCARPAGKHDKWAAAAALMSSLVLDALQAPRGAAWQPATLHL